jgi:predicted metal-dependent HD superfamily phosphohydrolase
MLWDKWNDLWRRLDAPGHPKRPFERLMDRYGEGHRHYHTVDHLQHCLTELGPIRDCAEDPDAVEMALWFHDAIYEPSASDNEERSAELARTVLHVGGFEDAFADKVAALVMATKHAGVQPGRDAETLLDCDLAILGAKPDAFDAYERGIRREYDFVPQPTFRERRAKILRAFLGRGAIYCTFPMRAKYEHRARKNLERSIARLEGGGPLP